MFSGYLGNFSLCDYRYYTTCKRTLVVKEADEMDEDGLKE